MNYSHFVKLPKSFYVRDNVVEIAKDLLGKYLLTDIDGILTGGKIVETEAYCGRNDRACHAFGKRTPRTEVMYQEGGVAYVYLCYGIHHLFNVVTNVKGLADAVLIRAIEPVVGLEVMRSRRQTKNVKRFTSGPGKLTKALSIETKHTGYALNDNQIYLAVLNEDQPEIEIDVRIGVDYAGEDALKPWRFYIKENEWVSIKKSPDPERPRQKIQTPVFKS